MTRKRKTQPAAQLTELDKPAPFVPKTVTDFMPATSTGRPTKYDPKSTPKLVRGMAKQGLSEGYDGSCFGRFHQARSRCGRRSIRRLMEVLRSMGDCPF